MSYILYYLEKMSGLMMSSWAYLLVPLISWLICFGLYHKLKRIFWNKYKRELTKSDLFSPNKLKKHTELISLFLSLSITQFVLCFHLFFTLKGSNKLLRWISENIVTHFGLFLTVFLGTWGLLVSYNVLRQQKSQIVSFDEFLTELRDSLHKVRDKATLNRGKAYSIYLYDYHPLIGNYSSRQKFEEYINELRLILRMENIKVTMLTNHEYTLAEFFKKLSIDRDDEIIYNSFEAVEFIKNGVEVTNVVESAPINSFIWKSDNISEHHFVIVDDEAFQYVVLPQENEKNNIFGIKTEDPFVINYLEQSFSEKLKTTISLNNISLEEGKYCFRFEPQSNIERVYLRDFEGKEREISDLLKVDENNIEGFRINAIDVENLKFPIKYFLGKKGYSRSEAVPSKSVFYRELLEGKNKYQKIEYYQPTQTILKEQKKAVKEYLENLKSRNDQNAFVCIVSIFYDSDYYDFDLIQNEFSELLMGIPLNILSIKPESSLAVEVVAVNDIWQNFYSPTYQTLVDFNLCELVIDDNRHVFLANNKFNQSNNLDQNLSDVYDRFLEALKLKGLDIKDTMRQWNYVGGINSKTGKSNITNYAKFCEKRALVFCENGLDFIKDKKNSEHFPSATGIGLNPKNSSHSDVNRFTLSAFALQGTEFSIANLFCDDQNNPFEYTDPHNFGDGNSTPWFQRGKSIKFNDAEYLLVSGTASIKGEQTFESTILKSQCQKAINDLFELINHERDHSISLRNMSYIRIYYDGDLNDLKLLKSFLYPIIEKVPHIFLKTELCRENLKIEIECASL